MINTFSSMPSTPIGFNSLLLENKEETGNFIRDNRIYLFTNGRFWNGNFYSRVSEYKDGLAYAYYSLNPLTKEIEMSATGSFSNYASYGFKLDHNIAGAKKAHITWRANLHTYADICFAVLRDPDPMSALLPPRGYLKRDHSTFPMFQGTNQFTDTIDLTYVGESNKVAVYFYFFTGFNQTPFATAYISEISVEY